MTPAKFCGICGRKKFHAKVAEDTQRSQNITFNIKIIKLSNIMNTIKNKVQLLGNVGRDPEIIIFDDGRKMARFHLATNDHYTTHQGEKVEKTYWHRIIFWNKAADLIQQRVTTGSRLLIEGKLTTHSWEDEEGVKHQRSQIVGKEVVFL